MVPPEDIFGIIDIRIGVFLIAGISLCLSGVAFYTRVIRLVMLGKKRNLLDRPLKRLTNVLAIGLGQKKVLQRLSLQDKAGIGHVVIFYGFLSFLLSYVIFIFGDTAWHPFSETILSATGVKIYVTYLDIVALAILACLVWGIVRRWVVKPSRLAFDLTRSPDAVIIVSLISLLMLLTVSTEAFYVARGGMGPHADAIVGKFTGEMLVSLGMGTGVADVLHQASWWAHLLIILGFSIYIPFSKHMHMIAAPVNAYLLSLEPKGELETIDLETAEHFGAGRIQDFTWKQLLDGYACAVCGRCTDNCPANISGKTLSPMHIVEDLKDYLLEEGSNTFKGKKAENPLIGFKRITEEALWDCVSCGACMEECPVAVEHVPTIMDMRRHLVLEESKLPETAMNTLLSMEQRGHPWRGTQFSRMDWTEGLDIRTIAEYPDAEILFWVGCTSALEKRSQAIARSMAKVLKSAGVDFVVLGDEERCTGDPARRMGNEYLYQVMAQQNIDTMNRYNVKAVVTTCPHCFNTIKNEYPKLGGDYKVYHYSQFLDRLIKDGKIRPIKIMAETVAYHDSCYLGRHNGIYDEPRNIAKAIPGLELVEMAPRCRERGFCCGAGGGHMWLEESRGERINHVRTDQFLETGARVVGVSCPFCLQMMEEGIQAKEQSQNNEAKDLLEILAESIEG